VYKIS